ncbi:DUF4159 domain-containing protein [Rhodovibrionaceae bacterium A322]
MLTLGPLAFASPWLLLFLVLLPLLWWLLKATPPKARRLPFPAFRLLFGLDPKEETPDRTPWWLLLLRMLLVTLVILALAKPLLNPETEVDGSPGPVVLVVDNGWSAARGWSKREALLSRLLVQAERQNRPVLLLPTAPDPGSSEGPLFSLQRPEDLKSDLSLFQPRPWPSDYGRLAAALADFSPPQRGKVFWLSDGLLPPLSEEDQTTATALQAQEDLLTQLQRLGPVTLHLDSDDQKARLLLPVETEGLDFQLSLLRFGTEGREELFVRALDDEQRVLQRIALTFEDGEQQASASVKLPLELRNRITRLKLEGEDTVGTSLLVDERWRRRPVGLAVAEGGEEAQPLLSDHYYLHRALSPFTEITTAPLAELLKQRLAIIALPDLGRIPDETRQALAAWMDAGGLLLRFAGPDMTNAAPDLLPVRLRQGSRTLGGAMTWDRPAKLAAFPDSSPFFGVAIPDDVVVSRQVLAEPSLDLDSKTWARLEDGTPLISAEARGQGWLVLVHTSANTDWSNLALSGLFVEVLQKLVVLSQGVEDGGGEVSLSLPPLQSLDAFGRLQLPTSSSLAISPEDLNTGRVSPQHPPGLYGSLADKRALNLSDGLQELTPLPAPPANVSLASYAPHDEQQLGSSLLLAAFVLALLDLIISLWMRGLLLPNRAVGTAAGALLLPGLTAAFLAALLSQSPAQAQEGKLIDDRSALASARNTRLAYVKTGIPDLDRLSHDGLAGLSRTLTLRTAVEPTSPKGVTLGEDELAFYPLLYWPIDNDQRDLDSAARAAVNTYLKNGGTLIFDLREPSSRLNFLGETSPGQQALRRLTQGLDIPPLAPLSPDHVLTKTFYLLQEFPGRYNNATLWVEQPAETDHDGVSSVIITANDFAAAWAMDDMARPLYAVVPGGRQQREQAYRVGVNLTLYALTGNYKADQVHVPFILERLGQ